MNLKELRIGSHVLCGSIYKRDGRVFHIPPHYAEVVSIGDDWVCTVIDKEQGDPDEYSPEEVSGIPLSEEVLLKAGFTLVGTENDNDTEIKRYRYGEIKVTFRLRNDYRICSVDTKRSVVCGVEYMHTLEGIMIDNGIELQFDPYESCS